MDLLISYRQFFFSPAVVVVSWNAVTWSDNRSLYDSHHHYSIRIIGDVVKGKLHFPCSCINL